MRYLSRDPFARVTFIRHSVHGFNIECAWCGNKGKPLSNRIEYRLYQYGYEDDNGHVYLSRDFFCSKSCYECYN